MNKKQLNRVTFIGENKMVVDGEHSVSVEKNPAGKTYVYEKKDGSKRKFDDENLLFDYLDEMTSTGSVGGGMELPLATPKNKGAFMRRTISPYTDVVDVNDLELMSEELKKLTTELLKEEAKAHPNYNLIERYRKTNGEGSKKNVKEVEDKINIVYQDILKAAEPNYYNDNNDYNGDGIPNQFKENNTNLDLMYDGITDEFKERITKELSKDPTGVKLMQAALAKAKVKEQNPTNTNLFQLGSDIETLKVGIKDADAIKNPKGHARHGVAALGFKINEGKMVRFNFNSEKYDFEHNKKQLEESIPNKVKNEGTRFEMKDSKGNLYLLEWNNGEPTILEHRNLIAEEKANQKLNMLFEYKNWDKPVKSKKIEFDFFTKKSLNEEVEENDMVEYLVPEWSLSALVNGDFSGLSDEDEAKIEKFIKEVTSHYGNAHFIVGDLEGEDNLGFKYRNDIDNLGSNVYRLYIKPLKSKMEQ